MNRIKRLLLKQNKNHSAWKTPLSIASLALIATISVGASNSQTSTKDSSKKSPVATVEKEITDARAEVMVKITDALLAGKLTPEEAAQKIISFEEGVVEKMEYLRGIQERIEHAVDSGEMTRKEAEAKYDAMLKDKKESPGNERAKAYLAKVAGEIKEAVENGEMTPEEGKAKYAEAEERIEKRMGQKSEGNKRAQAYLAQVGAEIKKAVANGEMTAEEGKAKYADTVEAIKKRMMAAKSKGKSKKITKEEYAQAKSKMLRMVKTGEITREQMQQRLDRMSQVEASKDDNQRGESSDDCMALRRRLGQAVRNGEMTREEAGKIWEEEGC
jgi:polyhydroxyalkanoate synthesis regulator phasin